MTGTPWQRRIQRAEILSRAHPFAGEILSFYAHIARFQSGLHHRLEGTSDRPRPDLTGPAELPLLLGSFGEFLLLVSDHGPSRMSEAAGELRSHGEKKWSDLLNDFWVSGDALPAHPPPFLALAFLQPYAEWLRSRSAMTWKDYHGPVCPFCNRKPGLGLLRQMGDGALRSLMCSFCLAEWEFRRIICPACGEENHTKLPVYTAEEFDYIRVECCDTCKTYLKSINLTRNGLAEPLVDELASAPLDLWAREHGYTKLHPNLIGL